MPPSRKRASTANPTDDQHTGSTSDATHWTQAIGTPIRLDCILTGYDADVLRAAAKGSERQMEALRRVIGAAAKSDEDARTAIATEKALRSQIAAHQSTIKGLVSAYTAMAASYEAMVKHLEIVTAFQQRTATAAETVVRDSNDIRSRLIRATDALDANTARQKAAIDAQAGMLDAADRIRDDAAYLNGLVDALSAILPPPTSAAPGLLSTAPEPFPQSAEGAAIQKQQPPAGTRPA